MALLGHGPRRQDKTLFSFALCTSILRGEPCLSESWAPSWELQREALTSVKHPFGRFWNCWVYSYFKVSTLKHAWVVYPMEGSPFVVEFEF